MTEENAFFKALLSQGEGRIKIQLDSAWLAFQESRPDLFNNSSINQREILRSLLRELEDEGLITYPKGNEHWDSSAHPPLPKFIKIIKEAKIEWIPKWKHYPWRPELEWIPSIPNLSDLEMSNLVAINEFFKDVAGGKINAEPISVKERSWLLFGNENRLEALRGTRLFGEQRLSLEPLRCLKTWEPITFERFTSSREHSVIIIENKDTFHSFTRVCKQLGTRSPYEFIIYGGALAMGGSILSISMLDERIREIDYFGDVDPYGLRIPIEAQQKLASEGFMQKINPALPFYERAFKLYEESNFKSIDKGKVKKWDKSLIEFLPLQYRERTEILFKKGEYIPQIIVNYHQISMILRTI